MKIVSVVKNDELEIVKIHISKVLTIIVETFTVPEGYKSFARNTFLHHDDLSGYGVHKDKEESVNRAIEDLYELMDGFPVS